MKDSFSSLQAIEDFHSAHSRQPSFKHRHFHRSTDYIIDSSPVFDCPLVYGCHPVLVQECPDRSPAPSRRLRDDLATSRILIPADSIEEEPVEDIEVLRVSPPRKFSTDFRPLPSPSISKNDQEPKPWYKDEYCQSNTKPINRYVRPAKTRVRQPPPPPPSLKMFYWLQTNQISECIKKWPRTKMNIVNQIQNQ